MMLLAIVILSVKRCLILVYSGVRCFVLLTQISLRKTVLQPRLAQS